MGLSNHFIEMNVANVTFYIFIKKGDITVNITEKVTAF